MSDPLDILIASTDEAIDKLSAALDDASAPTDAATITMLREALIESKRETVEARAAAGDERYAKLRRSESSRLADFMEREGLGPEDMEDDR